MAELLLPSLEIENFRAFKHLTIEKLGRVNLIVGENSVGKTCLLEAIWIFANKADLLTLRELLSSRDERHIPSRLQDDDIENSLSSLKHLFYSRKFDIGTSHIVVGSTSLHKLEIGVNYYITANDGDDLPRHRTKLTNAEAAELDNIQIRLTVSENGSVERSHSIEYINKRRALFERDTSQPARRFLPTNGLDKTEIAWLWDAAAIQGLDHEAISVLKIIQPTLERLIMVEENKTSREFSSRIPMVKLKNLDYFVPLRSLGDGMWRALGISLALVNSKNGVLLIDEFENGLYHGVQTDLWRLVFRVAHELNVQVFATTHNWDCIEAFQKAAQEDQNEEAMLIRLQRQGEEIIAETYDERELMIATREHIEVR